MGCLCSIKYVVWRHHDLVSRRVHYNTCLEQHEHYVWIRQSRACEDGSGLRMPVSACRIPVLPHRLAASLLLLFDAVLSNPKLQASKPASVPYRNSTREGITYLISMQKTYTMQTYTMQTMVPD